MLRQRTPYMLRGDGKIFECGRMHPYVIYDVKQDNVIVALSQLFLYQNKNILWFYNHTLNNETRNIIRQLAKSYLIMYPNLSDWTNITDDLDIDDNTPYTDDLEEACTLLSLLNKLTNQEFCRIRTSDMYRIGNDDCIYFRISSVGFNWFNLIWQTVYDNQQYQYLTIVKDEQSFNNIDNTKEFYKLNGIPINHYKISDFIMIKGNPIIENYSGYHPLAKRFISSKSLDKSLYGNIQNQIRQIDWLAEEEKKNGFGWTINAI